MVWLKGSFGKKEFTIIILRRRIMISPHLNIRWAWDKYADFLQLVYIYEDIDRSEKKNKFSIW